MGSEKIGSAHAEIGLETSKVESGADRADKAVSSLEKKITAAFKSLTDGPKRAQETMNAWEKAVERAGGTSALSAKQLETLATKIQYLTRAGATLPDVFKGVGGSVSSASLAVSTATQQMSTAVQGAAARMGPMGQVLGALGAGGIATAAGMVAVSGAVYKVGELAVDATRKAASWGDELRDTATSSQMMVVGMQELREAAAVSGISWETVTKTVEKMNRTLEATPEVYERIGLNVQALRQLSPDQQFVKVVAAIQQLNTVGERSQALQDIFGKGSAALLRFDASARQASHSLGLVWSEAQVNQTSEFNDQVEQLERTLAGLWRNAGLAVAGNAQAAGGLKELTNAIGEFSREVLARAPETAEELTGLYHATMMWAALAGGGEPGGVPKHFRAVMDADARRQQAEKARLIAEQTAAQAAGPTARIERVAEMASRLRGVYEEKPQTDEAREWQRKRANEELADQEEAQKEAAKYLQGLEKAEFEDRVRQMQEEDKRIEGIRAEAAAAEKADLDNRREIEQLAEKGRGESLNESARAAEFAAERSRTVMDETVLAMGKEAKQADQNREAIHNLTDQREDWIDVLVEGGATEEEANKIIDDHIAALKGAKDGTVDWSAALQSVAQQVQVLGSGLLTDVAGGIASIGAQVQSVKKLGNLGDMFGAGDKKMDVGKLLSGASSMLAMAGAAKQIGGALGDALTKSGGEKAQGDVKRIVGLDVDEKRGDELDKRAKQLGIGRTEAVLLELVALAKEADRPLSEFQDRTIDLFNAVALGGVPAREGVRALKEQLAALVSEGEIDDATSVVDRLMQAIDDGSIKGADAVEMLSTVFQGLTEAAADGLGAARSELVDFIREAKAGGETIQGLKEFTAEKLAGAGADLTTLFRGAVTGKTEEGKDIYSGGVLRGTAAGELFGANLEALSGAEGLVAAIKELAPAWEQIQGTGAFAGPSAARDLMSLGSEKTLPLLEQLEALQRQAGGLGATGSMTTGSFAALQDAALAQRTQLEAAGGTREATLQAMGPLLAELQQSASDYGLVLSEDLKRTIADAQAAGVAFASDPQRELADAVQAQIAATEDATAATRELAEALARGVQINMAQLQQYHSGGYVPTDQIASLKAGEWVVPPGAAAAPSITPAALREAVGGMVIQVESTTLLDGEVVARNITRRQVANGQMMSDLSRGLTERGLNAG